MNQVVDERLFLEEAIGKGLSPQRTLSLRSWVYRQDHPTGLGGRMGMLLA